MLSLCLYAINDWLRYLNKVAARRLRHYLNLASRFQRIHKQVRVCDSRPRSEQTMIAQNHRILFAQIRYQARFFVFVERDKGISKKEQC